MSIRWTYMMVCLAAFAACNSGPAGPSVMLDVVSELREATIGADATTQVELSLVDILADLPDSLEVRGPEARVAESVETGAEFEVKPPDCPDAVELCAELVWSWGAEACIPAPLLDGTPCDDGSVCTLVDQCVDGECVGGETSDCDDGDQCTQDNCHPTDGCSHMPTDGPCDDGKACTEGDFCQDGACESGDKLECDDDNPCTDDGCSSLDGCVYSPNSKFCDDGNGCTGGDMCVGGACEPGPIDLCPPCDIDADCLQYDDGNLCNGLVLCVGGICELVDGTYVYCGDVPTDCVVAECDPASGECVSAALVDGSKCNDEDKCSWSDQCADGICKGTPTWCDDNDLCTKDWCDAGTGKCVFDPLGCDDQNVCTLDSCDPDKGCLHTDACPPDDDLCTQETCSPIVNMGVLTYACESSAPPCNGVNPCTTTTCVPKFGCQFPPLPDGTICNDDYPHWQCLAGNCFCMPDCALFDCGDDGCGGTCGTCEPGFECNEGTCTLVVTDCGDGICAGLESCSSCEVDCGQCDVCGNQELDPGEECDDGCMAGEPGVCEAPFDDGDGCSHTCYLEYEPLVCGNGVKEIANFEECDDGNDVDWDGCTDCTITEFVVNITGSGKERWPRVTRLGGGSCFVVWNEVSDFSTATVSGRLMKPGTFEPGVELVWDSFGGGAQKDPSVIGLQDGRAVVVWAGGQWNGRTIFGQFVGPDGEKQGEVFVISQSNIDQGGPYAVPLGSGFLVVWNRRPLYGDSVVLARGFDGQGSAIDDEVEIANWDKPADLFPALVSLEQDQVFAVAFAGLDTYSSTGAFTVFLDGQIAVLSSVLTVAKFLGTSHGKVRAVGWGGEYFMSTWAADNKLKGTDDVFAQPVASDGGLLGDKLQLNECWHKDQQQPAVAASSDGGFVAAWRSELQNSLGLGGSCSTTGDWTTNVFARKFDSDFAPVHTEFRTNLATKQDEGAPDVATFADGSFVVVWEACPTGANIDGLDGHSCAIMALRFSAAGKRLYL